MKLLSIVKVAAILIGCATLSGSPAFALESPKSQVVLVVKGEIGLTNKGKTAEFDLQMLENLGINSFDVQMPWVNGVNRFSGPPLKNLLAAVGARGKNLRLRALNDFEVTIPSSDADFGTILAIKMNDKLLSVRDKGPLFLVYPFHTNPALYNERYFSRSIWQIKELEIIP